MSRRIDIELTSSRDDDSWTWRAVGAREPKGTIAASLLPGDAKVGDELRVEADFFVEGIEIIAVIPSKTTRKEPEVLEILGSGRDTGEVTTSLVSKRGRRDDRGDGRPRGKGRGRGDRPDRGDRGNRESRGERGDQGRARSRDRDKGGQRPPRQERPAPPARPKPKRLRPQRVHRNAVLAELPEEQRPIAEQVLRGGMPAVRKAVEEQNQRNKAEGRPHIDPAPLLQLAESLVPGLKEAEWHDRADAAMAGMAEVDLRDLRSVVVAAESNARSEETRALAEQVREAVAGRVEKEHNDWLREIAEALDDERTVRALRMSSRPPKAGAPLPPDLNGRLVEAANAALSDDTGPQRWGTVLDAVAYSPIRNAVTPAGIPSRPNDELLETVKRLSSRVPEIATLFGVDPQKPPRKRRRSRSASRDGGGPRPPLPPKPAVVKEPAAAEPAVVKEPAAAEPAVAKEPAAAEPAVEKKPPAEEPAVEEPAAAEAVAAEPAVEKKPPAEEPAVEEPAAAEPAPVEPAAAEAVAVEPAPEEPAAAEPAVEEEPAAVEPAVEEAG